MNSRITNEHCEDIDSCDDCKYFYHYTPFYGIDYTYCCYPHPVPDLDYEDFLNWWDDIVSGVVNKPIKQRRS